MHRQLRTSLLLLVAFCLVQDGGSKQREQQQIKTHQQGRADLAAPKIPSNMMQEFFRFLMMHDPRFLELRDDELRRRADVSRIIIDLENTLNKCLDKEKQSSGGQGQGQGGQGSQAPVFALLKKPQPSKESSPKAKPPTPVDPGHCCMEPCECAQQASDSLKAIEEVLGKHEEYVREAEYPLSMVTGICLAIMSWVCTVAASVACLVLTFSFVGGAVVLKPVWQTPRPFTKRPRKKRKVTMKKTVSSRKSLGSKGSKGSAVSQYEDEEEASVPQSQSRGGVTTSSAAAKGKKGEAKKTAAEEPERVVYIARKKGASKSASSPNDSSSSTSSKPAQPAASKKAKASSASQGKVVKRTVVVRKT